MPIILSPNMNLPVPVVSQEPGPEYAIDINACMSLLDIHSHQPGSGVPITVGAINIDAALTFNSFSLEDLRDAKFTPQVSTLVTPTDKNSVYVVVDDLYYNNSAGTPIRITQSGAVVGTPGSITNLLPPASASYVPLSAKFVWESAVSTPADMDFGSAILRNMVINSFGLTLTPPTLTADYQITLPLLPSSQKIMTLDNTGAMTAPYVLDNSTLEVALNIIQVKNNGVTNAKLAAMPALSVKGNPTNVSTNPTDIVAASDGLVLRRAGASVGFGQIVTAGIATNAITTSTIADSNVTLPKLSSTVSVASAGGTGNTSLSSNTVPQLQTSSMTILNAARLITIRLAATAPDSNIGFAPGGTPRFGRVLFMVNVNGSGWVQAGFQQAFGCTSKNDVTILYPPSSFSVEIPGGYLSTGSSVQFGCLFNVNAGTINWQDVQVLAVQH